MKQIEKKKKLIQRRRWRIRKRIKGTLAKPRLSLYCSNKHIYAQCIDDVLGKTLYFVSSLSKDVSTENIKPNLEGARQLGQLFAEGAQSQGITSLVFDRNGRRYHGVVKAFADAVRQSGLAF